VKNDDKTDLNAFVEEIEAKILEEEREIYTERTLKEANDPKNLGEIKGANGFGKVTGPCGDTMQICLKIEDDKITGSKFLTDGCGSSIACGSVITELVKSKSIEEALKVGDKDILSVLGGLPEENLHCSVLAADTLRAAIEDYIDKGKGGYKK
jgi:NifU homolog involved in Fe-S cluster formation